MGLVGVRDADNAKFYEAKKPLCVVYYDVDYGLNPKGRRLYLILFSLSLSLST